MDRLPAKRAFVVEGAHLYGELLDFDALVAERDNRETESSHANVLRFLRVAKKVSTAFSQEQDVGVKWNVQRGCRASQAPTFGCLWTA